MTEREREIMKIGHSNGLLHAYYALSSEQPEAAEHVRWAHREYCRTWGIYNELERGGLRDGTTESVGSH